MKLLLENGADPNAQNSQALVYASRNGHTEIAKLLLKNGENPLKLPVIELFWLLSSMII